jgi:hypothetical protein
MDLNGLFADIYKQMIIDAKDTLNLKVNSHEINAKVERVPKIDTRRVTIPLNGDKLVAVEVSPFTHSVWGEAVLDGNKVMQVATTGGRYVGVVVNGKVGQYPLDADRFLAESVKK